MSEINDGDMPTDFWAWMDNGRLAPLGVCDNYTDAFDKAEDLPHNYSYVFSRQGLMEMQAEIERVLK